MLMLLLLLLLARAGWQASPLAVCLLEVSNLEGKQGEAGLQMARTV